MTRPATGLLVGNDLFFGSRITGTAAELGYRIEIAASLEQATARLREQSYRGVFVDLALPGLNLGALVAALPVQDRPRVVAFGAHVHTQLLEAARAAGCDNVLPRSRFSAHLPEILRQTLGPPPTEDATPQASW